MGNLAKGLIRWVNGMNAAQKSTGDQKAEAEAEIKAGFDLMTGSIGRPKTWDSKDRIAADILTAFDLSKIR